MTTYSALTTVTGEDAAYALAEDCEALSPDPIGVGVFEIEDGSGLWEVAVYFTETPDIAALEVLTAAHDAKSFLVSEIPDEDWVAKVQRELSPVEAGRFYVYGSHDAGTVPEDAVPLLIEASMAFGTGHHGTTLGCLRAFDGMLSEGLTPARVLDLGCGTAVLAMAAAKTLDAQVLASDIDPVAVEVAEANVRANGLTGQVECLVAAGFDAGRMAEAGPYDLIFANILKGPLVSLAPEIAANTAEGGHVILSGLLNEQAEEVRESYAAKGLSVMESLQIGDWTTLKLAKTR